jgi:hypothetical protein
MPSRWPRHPQPTISARAKLGLRWIVEAAVVV